jgi:replicative DNA helicase
MADLRVLFNSHFQKCFLAFMLRDSSFLERVVRDISQEMFTDDYAQRLVIAIKEFYRTHRAAPDTLIFPMLDNFVQAGILKPEVQQLCSKLADDLFAMPLQNQGYLLAEFDKFLKHQLFAARLPEIVECVRKADFEQAEAKLKQIFTFRPSTANDLGTEFGDAVESRNARREAEDETRFWLLLPPIDRYVRGLRRGEVGVWQSQRSSAGKSCALAHCAKAFAMQGLNVVIFTLEMGESAYEDRLDMAVSGLSREGLKDGERLRVRIQGLLRNGGRIIVKSFPGYSTRCSDLRTHCRMLESLKGFKPDAVLIDYADLLAPETPTLRGDLYATGAEVYSYWRSWMVEEKLVGWTGMQSGRDAMSDKFADQQHAAGSLAKIQIADVVLSINRTPEEEANGQTRIHIVKAREDKARFEFCFPTDFERMQFWDASRDSSWQEQIVA